MLLLMHSVTSKEFASETIQFLIYETLKHVEALLANFAEFQAKNVTIRLAFQHSLFNCVDYKL